MYIQFYLSKTPNRPCSSNALNIPVPPILIFSPAIATSHALFQLVYLPLPPTKQLTL
jgi:hypothetical protein